MMQNMHQENDKYDSNSGQNSISKSINKAIIPERVMSIDSCA